MLRMADPRPIPTDVPAKERRSYLESLGFELDEGKWKPPADLEGTTPWVEAFGAPWREPFTTVLFESIPPTMVMPRWALVLAALLFEAASASPRFTTSLVGDALAWCSWPQTEAAQRAAALMSVACLGGGEAELRAMMVPS